MFRGLCKHVKSRIGLGLLVLTMVNGIIAASLFVQAARTVAPLPAPNSPVNVAIVKDTRITSGAIPGNDTLAIVKEMVQLAVTRSLGSTGMAALVNTGDTVLIKPNLVTQLDAWKTGTTTAWQVVRALADLAIQAGAAKVIIAEGNAMNTTMETFSKFGYTSTNFPDPKVRFFDLNDITNNPTSVLTLTDGLNGDTKEVVSAYLNADVVISVPKMKTHANAGATLSLKNIGLGIPPFALTVDPTKGYKWNAHSDLRRNIVDYNLCRKSDFSVIDGIIAMEGNGPVGGPIVKMGLVLASRDPVAVDAVAASVMGIPPFRITHIVLAAHKNLGVMDLDKINVVGESIASVKRSFQLAPIDSFNRLLGDYAYRATTVICRNKVPVSIDGSLGEWGNANKLVASEAWQIINGNASNWSGAADCGFTAKLLYDSDNLYFSISVTDSRKMVNSRTGNNIINGDAVELWLSTYATQYDETRSHAAFDARYDYKMAFSYADNPASWILSHNKALTGAEIQKSETADGYVLEAKIPWSNFPGMSNFTAYREMAVNVVVDDADNSASTRDNKIAWENKANLETDPTRLGVCYMAPLANSGTVAVKNSFEKQTGAASDRLTVSASRPIAGAPVKIAYALSSDAAVDLDVYNMSGTHIRSLVNVRQTAGTYQTEWNGTNAGGGKVASGTYVIKLVAGKQMASKRVSLYAR